MFPGNYTYATSGHRAQTRTTSGRDDNRGQPSPPRSPVSSPPSRRPETATTPRPVAKATPRAPQQQPEEPTKKIQQAIAAKEERVRQLEADFNEARRVLDFARAREIWAERQILIDEVIVLRNQDIAS